MSARPFLLRRIGAVVVALFSVSLVATACDDSGSSADRPSTTGAPATTATTAAPAPDCGNPVASFPPLNPMPDPGDMPAGSYMQTIQQRGRLIAGVSADTLLFG